MRWIRFVMLGLMLGLASCASSSSSPSTPFQPSKPATMNIEMTMSFEIPGPIARQYDVAQHLQGFLKLHADSQSVSNDPKRSKQQGTFDVQLADDTGKHKYVDIHTTLNGEADGSPEDGMWRVFGQIGNVLDLAARAAKTSPTQP